RRCEAMGAWARGPRLRREGRAARPLLHRVRHPRSQDDRAGARAREEQLCLFTDNIPDPVVYLDTERRYTFVNEAFLNLNRLKRSAVIDKALSEVKGVAAMNTIAPDYDRAFAGETVGFEREFIDANGRARWIRGRMVPDHRIDGAIRGVYVVGHDI